MSEALNHHHRQTLDALFAHPTRHNLQWKDVGSLLSAIGDVEEKHDGRVSLTVAGQTKVLGRPKGKDVGAEELIEIRQFLKSTGFEPQS